MGKKKDEMNNALMNQASAVIDEKQRKIVELKVERDAFLGELNKVENERDALRAENLQLSKSISETERWCNALRDELRKIKAQCNDTDIINTGLGKLLSKVEDERDTLIKERDALRIDLNSIAMIHIPDRNCTTVGEYIAILRDVKELAFFLTQKEKNNEVF